MYWLTTLWPSIAAIVWAAAWLQHTRDRKLADAHKDILHKNAAELEDVQTELQELRIRVTTAENHIGQLTDRAMR